MKKKIFAVIVSSALVLSLGLFAGCANNNPAKENATVNQAQAFAPTVKNGELVSINPDAAIDIALRHAGAERKDAVLFGAPKLDEENGKPHYDVEFGYNGFEFDYEISVDDGAVLKAEKEAEKADAPVKETVSEKNAAPSSSNGFISVENAKQKALDDAGIKSEEAVFLKAYYDSNDIVPHYDIKFESKGYEYEYEIMASDGSVLEKDIDKERGTGKASADTNEYISEDKAKSISLEHASVKAADVKLIKAELDRDDLVVHYDVEFVSGKFEYEYEINAKSGKIIAFSKEIND